MNHPVCGLGNGDEFQIGDVSAQAFGQAGQQGHIVLRPKHQGGHLDAQRFRRDLYSAGARVCGGCRSQGRCAVVIQAALQAVLPDAAVARFDFWRQPVCGRVVWGVGVRVTDRRVPSE